MTDEKRNEDDIFFHPRRHVNAGVVIVFRRWRWCRVFGTSAKETPSIPASSDDAFFDKKDDDDDFLSFPLPDAFMASPGRGSDSCYIWLTRLSFWPEIRVTPVEMRTKWATATTVLG